MFALHPACCNPILNAGRPSLERAAEADFKHRRSQPLTLLMSGDDLHEEAGVDGESVM
jgi:hypothetical protein